MPVTEITCYRTKDPTTAPVANVFIGFRLDANHGVTRFETGCLAV